MEPKAKHKIHLCFIYILHTRMMIALYNIFDKLVHKTKFHAVDKTMIPCRCPKFRSPDVLIRSTEPMYGLSES